MIVSTVSLTGSIVTRIVSTLVLRVVLPLASNLSYLKTHRFTAIKDGETVSDLRRPVVIHGAISVGGL